MSNNTLLSIVIPVYNAEPYLQRCVESCIIQGLRPQEQEIIICDDGSTDGSLALARSLAAQDNRIKVFNQKNEGSGMARNLGLNHATGRYVMFVDSDDYLHSNSVMTVLEICERNALDLCKYIMECVELNTGNHNLSYSPVETNKLFTGFELLGNQSVPLDSACSSIYRKDFLDSNCLRFTNMTSSEDVAFNLHVFLHAKRIMYSNIHVYTYEIRSGSRGHSTDLYSRTRYFKNNLRNAALVMYESVTNECLLDSTKHSLRLRSNSMTAGNLLYLLNSRQSIPRIVATEILDLASELGIYPIHGATFSWKTTLLSHVLLNRKKLLLSRFKTTP